MYPFKLVYKDHKYCMRENTSGSNHSWPAIFLKSSDIQVPPIRGHGDREEDKKCGPAKDAKRARDKNTFRCPVILRFQEYFQATIHCFMLCNDMYCQD